MSVSRRNNNPGNIVASKFAERRGGYDSDGDGFANFPSSAIGFMALYELITCSSYRNLTIAQAIHRYAPASVNPTAAYISYVTQATNLPQTTRIKNMTNSQVAGVCWAIAMFEGWS